MLFPTEDLNEKLECTSQLYSTLLSDNAVLRDQLKSLQGGSDASDGGGSEAERLRKQVQDLQKVMDEQVCACMCMYLHM